MTPPTYSPVYPRPCARCGRSMRPAQSSAKDWPTTKAMNHGRGLCTRCHDRSEVDGTIEDYPPDLWRRDELLAEVRRLLTGRTPKDVARVLGIQRTSISRQAYRAGDKELGRAFGGRQ